MKSILTTIVIATTFLIVVAEEEESSNAWHAHRGRLLFRQGGRSYLVSTTKWREATMSLRESGGDHAGRICVNVKIFDRDVDRTIAWPRFRFYKEYYVENSNVRTTRRIMDRFALRDDVTVSLTREWSRASDDVITSGTNAVTTGSSTCSIHVVLRVRPVSDNENESNDCGYACIRNDTVYISDRATYHVFSRDREFVTFSSSEEFSTESDNDRDKPAINLNLALLQLFTQRFWGIGGDLDDGELTNEQCEKNFVDNIIVYFVVLQRRERTTTTLRNEPYLFVVSEIETKHASRICDGTIVDYS